MTPLLSFAAIRRTLRALFSRRRLDRDVEDEVRFHLEMSTAANLERGMSEKDAMLAAKREFGNPGYVADASRDIKRATSLEQFGHDLVSGWRTARRAPIVAVTAVVILGLGIGSSTTMFSITHGILRDLPVDHPEELVHVAAINRLRGWTDSRLTPWEFRAIDASQNAVASLGGAIIGMYHLGEPGRFGERWSGAAITPNVFPILRVTPSIGRGFTEDDAIPGAPSVVILSDALWRQHFQGDSSVIGRQTRVNGALRTVVGVMRDGFRFPREQDIWIPQRPEAAPPIRAEPSWIVFGRLRPGLQLETAKREIASRDSAITLQSLDRDPERRLLLRSYREQQFSSKVLPIFGGMLLVVSFVLLIACANVAGVLLARGAGRRREMAVRAALGASRRRLTVQLLSEVLIMAIGGGLLGLALAAIGIKIFNARVGFELSYWMSVRLDGVVFVFITLLIGAATLLAGLAPARRTARADVGETLKSSSRGSSGFRAGRLNQGLVGFEVALSAALLVVTALMVEGVRVNLKALTHVKPEELQITGLELRPDAYPDSASRRRFVVALENTLNAVTGTAGYGLSTALPGNGGDAVPFMVDGAVPNDTARTYTASTTAGFFHTFDATPLRGREFNSSDDERAPAVVIVNQRFARKQFGQESPVGRRIRLAPHDSTSPWRTIIGVVSDIERRSGAGADSGIVYLPLAQDPQAAITIAVRDSRQAQPTASRVADAVRALDPEVTITTNARFDDLLARDSSSERVFAGLFLFFGLVALLLASVGLGSLITLTLQQQRQEMGIRLALGARTAEVVRLVARSGLQQLVIGLVAGLVLAIPIARTLGGALMGADANSAAAYFTAGVSLLLAGGMAAWVPVRRALQIAPAEVLRAE